jgi:hypothetical protein
VAVVKDKRMAEVVVRRPIKHLLTCPEQTHHRSFAQYDLAATDSRICLLVLDQSHSVDNG